MVDDLTDHGLHSFEHCVDELIYIIIKLLMSEITNYSNVRLSSDRHLFHKNILKYDRFRDFNNLEEMHEYIINAASQKIPETDTLIFLGDLCFWHLDEVDKMLERIKCRKIWIKWNHDSGFTKLSKHFELITDRYEFNNMLFIHYPPVDYDWTIRYNPDSYDYVFHWHDHNSTWPKDYWYNVCYNWWQLLYNLESTLNYITGVRSNTSSPLV